MSKVELVLYQEEHLNPLLGVLQEVRQNHPSYPPLNQAGSDEESFLKWFTDEQPIYRLTALLDGEPIGHGSLVDSHGYITRTLSESGFEVEALNSVEISKLFVSPRAQSKGVASRLLSELTGEALDRGMVAASCILASTTESLALHKKFGFELVNTFAGIDGVNHVLILP